MCCRGWRRGSSEAQLQAAGQDGRGRGVQACPCCLAIAVASVKLVAQSRHLVSAAPSAPCSSFIRSSLLAPFLFPGGYNLPLPFAPDVPTARQASGRGAASLSAPQRSRVDA